MLWTSLVSPYRSLSYVPSRNHTVIAAGSSNVASGSNQAPPLPTTEAAQVIPQQQQHYDDPFARPGIPTVAQAPRQQLVVRNLSPEPVEDSSSSSGRARVTDGKGRPVNARGEKAALVHLDGGAFAQPPAPAPPAYME